MIDHFEQHLLERIDEAEAAIAKYIAAVEYDDYLTLQFIDTDPATAQIYQDWKRFNQDKVTLFKAELQTLQKIGRAHV